MILKMTKYIYKWLKWIEIHVKTKMISQKGKKEINEYLSKQLSIDFLKVWIDLFIQNTLHFITHSRLQFDACFYFWFINSNRPSDIWCSLFDKNPSYSVFYTIRYYSSCEEHLFETCTNPRSVQRTSRHSCCRLSIWGGQLFVLSGHPL